MRNRIVSLLFVAATSDTQVLDVGSNSDKQDNTETHKVANK